MGTREIREAIQAASRDLEAGCRGDTRNRAAFRLQRRLDLCGLAHAQLERVDSDGMRHRMVMPLPCGHRACETCGPPMREAASRRMRHPWRSMITLTVPRTVSSDDAWRSMSSWVSRWMAAWRRWMQRNRPEESREYAWVLEDHQDGYPHVHIVLAASITGSRQRWMAMRDWVWSSWRSVTGLECRRLKIEALRSGSATRAYITKYLSKASYQVWHYALIGRRRMWGTSLKATPAIPSGWRLERILTEQDSPAASQEVAERMIQAGWAREWTSESGVECWIRPEWDVPDIPDWIRHAVSGMDPPAIASPCVTMDRHGTLGVPSA